MKSYISIINDFWRVAESSGILASDVAIFFFILNKMNNNHWQMPIFCSTTHIAEVLGLSRETIIAARERLMKRGLIYFANGRGNRAPAQYYLGTSGQLFNQLTVQPSNQLSNQLSNQPSKKSTENLTVAAGGIRYIIDKNKEEDKDKININNNILSYQNKLIEDVEWHQVVVDYMARSGREMTTQDVTDKVKEFISYLTLINNNTTDETELKKYFINWLHKNSLTNNKNKNNHGTHIKSASTAESYQDIIKNFE